MLMGVVPIMLMGDLGFVKVVNILYIVKDVAEEDIPDMVTRLSKLNYYWMDKVVKLKMETPNKRKARREYLGLINVFDLDHANHTKPKLKNNWRGIKVTCKVHRGWLEWERVKHPKGGVDSQSPVLKHILSERSKGPFGKYQYYFKSKQGTISMVKLNNYSLYGDKDVWEIFAYDDPKLFMDVQRFSSKRQAEKKVREYLKPRRKRK